MHIKIIIKKHYKNYKSGNGQPTHHFEKVADLSYLSGNIRNKCKYVNNQMKLKGC